MVLSLHWGAARSPARAWSPWAAGRGGGGSLVHLWRLLDRVLCGAAWAPTARRSLLPLVWDHVSLGRGGGRGPVKALAPPCRRVCSGWGPLHHIRRHPHVSGQLHVRAGAADRAGVRPPAAGRELFLQLGGCGCPAHSPSLLSTGEPRSCWSAGPSTVMTNEVGARAGRAPQAPGGLRAPGAGCSLSAPCSSRSVPHGSLSRSSLMASGKARLPERWHCCLPLESRHQDVREHSRARCLGHVQRPHLLTWKCPSASSPTTQKGSAVSARPHSPPWLRALSVVIQRG